jgi:hypothetical protein
VSSDSAGVAWHVLSAAGDVTLSRFGPIPGRGANPDSDDAMTGFSADAQYVALEHTFSPPDSTTPPFQVVRLSDHKLVYSRKDGTMATWAGSGSRLFFRTLAGVESWDPKSGVQVAVPGLAWIHPWPSPDGLRIVYNAPDGTGNHHAGYLRLTDQPLVGRELSFQPRTGAAFLNSTLVWYAGESVCTQVSCGRGGPFCATWSRGRNVSRSIPPSSTPGRMWGRPSAAALQGLVPDQARATVPHTHPR